MKDYENFVPENYNVSEKTLNGIVYNIFGLFMPAVCVLLFGYIYYLVWGNPFQNLVFDFSKINTFDFFVGLFGSAFLCFCIMICNSMLKGIFWSKYTDVRINMQIKSFAFRFCFLKNVIKKSNFIFGLFMPTIILGIIPTIFGIIIGSIIITFLGTMVTSLGACYIYILLLLRNAKKSDFIKEMDQKFGYIIYSPKI